MSDYVSEEGVSSLIVNKRKRLLKLEKMVLPPGIEPNTKFVQGFKCIALPSCHYYDIKCEIYFNKNTFLVEEEKKNVKKCHGHDFWCHGHNFLNIEKCHAHKNRVTGFFWDFCHGQKKNVTAIFLGPKLSRPFFRSHGHFWENCHGHKKKCHGEKKKHWSNTVVTFKGKLIYNYMVLLKNVDLSEHKCFLSWFKGHKEWCLYLFNLCQICTIKDTRNHFLKSIVFIFWKWVMDSRKEILWMWVLEWL